jgi:hypothetical protein
VKRIIIASVMAMTVVAAMLAASTMAGASGPGAVITFGPTSATLQIPTPPCPTTEPGCVWKFFLNEPKVSVDVDTVYGTSGTLTIAYPANFCGIIQADAYIGPTANGPWTPQRGWQKPLTDVATACMTPVTPPPSGGSQTTPVVTPPAQAATTTPPVQLPDTQQATDGTVATTPTTAPVTPAAAPVVQAASAPTSLPFTGVNLMPFVLIGVTCVALGLGLLLGRRKEHL